MPALRHLWRQLTSSGEPSQRAAGAWAGDVMADEPATTPNPAADAATSGAGGSAAEPDAQVSAEDLAALDDRSRALVERANAEAAARRREIRQLEQQLEQHTAELERHRRESETESERLVREAEQRGRDTASAEYERRLATSAVIAGAAGRLRDPADAAAHLDVDAIAAAKPDDQPALITRLLDDLLTAKPYLALDATNGGSGALVSQGGRSQPPGSSPGTPDAWLRQQAHRR